MKKPKVPFDQMQPAQQAGILCNDIAFRRYVGEVTISKGHMVQISAAAEYIRQKGYRP